MTKPDTDAIIKGLNDAMNCPADRMIMAGCETYIYFRQGMVVRYIEKLCDEFETAIQHQAIINARIWVCGCGTSNGVNLAVCRNCGRKEIGGY